MHYIIIDLEYNQAAPSEDLVNAPLVQGRTDISEQKPNLTYEIIQIGAVKLNHNLETVGSFRRFVKPTLHTRMNPFVAELTGITEEQLDQQEYFPFVYQDFVQFISDPAAVFCIWGPSDIKELNRNADFHKLNYNLLPKRYLDIQPYTSQHLGLPRIQRLKLQAAVEILKIEQILGFHDAYCDAYYTAEVFKRIYQDDFTPAVYNHVLANLKLSRRARKKLNLSEGPE